MIYTVPTTKAKQFLADNPHIMATDEGEAVSMAVGEYLATGKIATVVIGENGLLNALDSIITLVNFYNIPVDIRVYVRDDEPQHKVVAEHVYELSRLYDLKIAIL